MVEEAREQFMFYFFAFSKRHFYDKNASKSESNFKENKISESSTCLQKKLFPPDILHCLF